MEIPKVAGVMDTGPAKLMELGHIKKDQVTMVIQQTEAAHLIEKVLLAIIPGVITDLLRLQDRILQVQGEGLRVTEEVLRAREVVQEEGKCLIIT